MAYVINVKVNDGNWILNRNPHKTEASAKRTAEVMKKNSFEGNVVQTEIIKVDMRKSASSVVWMPKELKTKILGKPVKEMSKAEIKAEMRKIEADCRENCTWVHENRRWKTLSNRYETLVMNR